MGVRRFVRRHGGGRHSGDSFSGVVDIHTIGSLAYEP